MPKPRKLRYYVTGPGLDVEPSYAEIGPALSRATTAAEQSHDEGTWYVRDGVTRENVGYVECIRQTGILVTVTKRLVP